MQAALLRSERQDWNTPLEIVECLNCMGGVALDPCSNENSIVRARVEWRLSPTALALLRELEHARALVRELRDSRSLARELPAAKAAIRVAERALAEHLADPRATANGLRDSWREAVEGTQGRLNRFFADREWRSLVYVNPPYGRDLPAWADKVASEAKAGCEIVALVPARPDTHWFLTLFEAAASVLFWRGRLTFLGASTGAPFPSALFYFGARCDTFAQAFAGRGLLVACQR